MQIKKRKVQHEEALQIKVANYLREQYPKLFWFHPANERKTPMRISKTGKWFTPQGAKLKRMGVRAGVPDILIFKNYHQETSLGFGLRHLTYYTGLAIELKVKPNKPSPEQIEALEKLKEEGWMTKVCYSFDEAKKTIDDYLNPRV